MSSRLESVERWLAQTRWRGDVASMLVLTLLWAFYFWRVLTPGPDQVSLPEGDFSGQFFAFGAYQARRLLAGEIPLWNPFNNGGHPFLADTQAAVFYPPRLVTIIISHLFFGGWSYAALQAEAIAHYWLAAILMFSFVRSATTSRLAGVVSGIVFAFGGYLTGYPPLQLAVLEAGIWLPLGLLGILKASEDSCGWHPGWLALAAGTLGISLLAGHPQTSLFTLYVMAAYMLHRAHRRGERLTRTLPVVAATIGAGFALAAVQMLPGLEYLRLTTRAGYGFDALSGGFPFSDLATVLFPGVLTEWSPLYNGIAPLALAGIAVWRRVPSARFWAGVVLVAMAVSFGGAAVFYRLAYLLAPGFSLFRGQERAAFVIAHGVAILSGAGVAALRRGSVPRQPIIRTLRWVAAAAWAYALLTLLVERTGVQANLFPFLKATFLLALLTTGTLIIAGFEAGRARRSAWPVALVALLVADLFTVTMGTNWQPTAASGRTLLSDLAPAVTQPGELYRIDAQIGLSEHGPGENYGTLLGIQDVRGTSPLRLEALERYYRLPQYRLHQLLSVRYVLTDWQELEVPSVVRARGQVGALPVYVHEIKQPYPRAWMAYRVMITTDDAQALGWLADPGFDPATTVILTHDPGLSLPDEPVSATVEIVSYAPERIMLDVSTPTDGVLVISEFIYPGWEARVDGSPVRIWTADAGLRALPLRAGDHAIVLTYQPRSFAAGAAFSLIALVGLVSAALYRRRPAAHSNGEA